MKIKPVFVLVAVGALVGLTPFISTVNARPVYNAIMTFQYKLREDKELRSTCLYCHVSPEGGDQWNPFGSLMQEVFSEDGERLVPKTLYLTLKRNVDSDKDGYRDVLEVVGKSFPGNKNSVPTQTVEALETKLEAMGGVDAFLPIVIK